MADTGFGDYKDWLKAFPGLGGNEMRSAENLQLPDFGFRKYMSTNPADIGASDFKGNM